MKIAVDFDGTIVEHAYPAIGREMRGAFQALKKLQEQGHQLILWTYRAGRTLDLAIRYCQQNGIEFYAVNASQPGERFPEDGVPRKVDADLYIDDRNVGGFIGWHRVLQIVEELTKKA